MKKEDAGVLFQLISSLKDSVAKMEDFYNKGDAGNLNLIKEHVIEIQKKIDAILI